MENCAYCKIEMRKSKFVYRSEEYDAFQCPKCKRKIFTEEQATDFARKMDAARLQKEYVKKPLRIGRSWAMTFPKEMADVYDLGNPKTRIRLISNIKDNKIELEIAQ